MRKIAVLGTGCAKCAQLARNAEEAAKAAGVAYELEKVSDINQILAYGVMTTPALVIDGKVACVGKVPTIDDIAKMLA
jgi:small redox-active disulfide protein 2